MACSNQSKMGFGIHLHERPPPFVWVEPSPQNLFVRLHRMGAGGVQPIDLPGKSVRPPLRSIVRVTLLLAGPFYPIGKGGTYAVLIAGLGHLMDATEKVVGVSPHAAMRSEVPM